MKFDDYFPRVRIISLIERKDRRQAMMRDLARLGMKLGDGRCEFFPGFRPENPAGFESVGARGCFLSHLSILQRAEAESWPNALVFEDDLSFTKQFFEERDHLAESLKNRRWGFIYWGHIVEQPDTAPAELVPYTGPLRTTHFYAVNGWMIPRLRHYLEQVLTRPPGDPRGGPMHVDGAFSMFRAANPDVTTLLAVPSLGLQRSSRSDIAANSWFDRTPVLRDLATLARDTRTRVMGVTGLHDG